MAITQAICNSFKKELLDGAMSFKQTGGDTYKLALYSSTATHQTHPTCLLYTSPSPRDGLLSRMPSSA